MGIVNTTQKIQDCTFVGDESEKIEFKVFTIKDLEKYFSYKLLEQWIFNHSYCFDKSLFDKMTLAELSNFNVKYIPKYISCFTNAKINGVLYYGINDFGFVDGGMPYFGKLDKDIIISKIKDCIVYSKPYTLDKTQLLIEMKTEEEKNFLEDYYNNQIKVELIKVDQTDNTISDSKKDFDTKIKQLTIDNNNINKEWQDFKIVYNIWYDEILLYSSKMINFLENERLYIEIKEYIASFLENPNYKKSDIELALSRWTNMNSTKNNCCIINIEYMDKIKNDDTDPFRWVAEYKDKKAVEINKLKPQKPSRLPKKAPLREMINNISDIKHRLLVDKCSFYVIKISINYIENIMFKYKKSSKSSWVAKRRIIDSHNGPSCITI